MKAAASSGSIGRADRARIRSITRQLTNQPRLPASIPAPWRDFAAVRAARGYVVTYDPDQATHCPGCGRSAWLIGRSTAECAACGTAVPLSANLFNQTPPVTKEG